MTYDCGYGLQTLIGTTTEDISFAAMMAYQVPSYLGSAFAAKIARLQHTRETAALSSFSNLSFPAQDSSMKAA